MTDNQEPNDEKERPGKAWLISRIEERCAARTQAIEDLFNAAETDAALELLTNKDLAALIKEHLMPDLNILEPAYLLLDEACARLEK